MGFHKSVLLNEVLLFLDPKPGDLIVDGTVGRAGHAQKILEAIGTAGRLIGFDRDVQAISECEKILSDRGDRVMLFHDDFKNIASRLQPLNQLKADGILLDLGVSSPQLEDAERGFSFKSDGPLDMRMNTQDLLTAHEVVNRYSERSLADIFWKYGEERFSRRIAKKIVEARSRIRINTTAELESIIWQSVPASYRHGRIHPATRTFQAIRIEVNHEMESLEVFLAGVPDILAEGGRLVIISFHSLEDRIVKNGFKAFVQQEKGEILTKKPVEASSEEIQDNPRSRSAKLRAFRMN